MMPIIKKITSQRILFRIGLLIAAGIILIHSPFAEGSHIDPPIFGWFWGGTTDDALGSSSLDTGTGIGWVSVTTHNSQPCNQGNVDCYGVTIPVNNGDVTGYAWSSNVGWIDFHPNPPYPAVPASYNYPVRRNGSNLEGWARIEGIRVSGADGLLGWIRMRGTVTSGGTYGVTILPATQGVYTDRLSGYAWSDEFGWLYFGNGPDNPPYVVGNFSTIPPPPPPTPSADIKAGGSDGPLLVVTGSSALISWNSLNVSACSVTDNGNPFGNGTSGSQSSGALSGMHTYVETCNGANGPASDSVVVDVTVPGVISCTPKIQGVHVNSPAHLLVTGTGPFNWTAVNGIPSSGSGTSFTTTYSAKETYTVHVQSGSAADDCSVKAYNLNEEIPFF